MTRGTSIGSLVRAGLRHYAGTHAMVVAGVAVSVAVLAGALLVGASVRASLRELALARLGRTDLVLSSTSFFRQALADAIAAEPQAAALIALNGALVHEPSGRTAARVQVLGIDQRFARFNGSSAGPPTNREAWISGDLARELDAKPGDGVLLRIAKPTDVPLSTLQGRRDEAGERVRFSIARIADRASLGEFSLAPAQGPAFTIFVALDRLQRDLDVAGRVNTVLLPYAGGNPDRLQQARETIAARIRADDLGLKMRTDSSGQVQILESASGLLPPAVVETATARARASGLEPTPVLTYLANTIRIGDREIPYSVVTAIDLPHTKSSSLESPIWLNEWAAEHLRATRGETVWLDYFLWSDEEGLRTDRAAFTFAGTIPMNGLGGDRTLTPDYPGISDAADVTSWDPPFPVDLRRVRKEDEAYWDQWRTAPKAFIPLAAGQRLWPSAFGDVSSIRITRRAGVEWSPLAGLDPFTAGFTLRDARTDAMAASEGTTDFGEYFVYFSFFLVVAGLLLSALFFALTVEQRSAEIGILEAVGFAPRVVQGLLLREAAVLALVGTVGGMIGAVGYAALIMYGLGTWWVDAVGTTELELHVQPLLVVAGGAAAFLTAIIALLLSFRRVTRRSTRALLLGAAETAASPERGRSILPLIAAAAAAAAIALSLAATFQQINPVAGFFGAGGAVLIAGIAAFGWWLRRSSSQAMHSSGVVRLGAAYARWRPTRSVLCASLIASACFVLVAVGAFRRDLSGVSLDRNGGTGGFVLIAESVVPIVHNPNTPEGRDELGLSSDPLLDRVRVARFRLRPGDETSCLTLYQPKNPRIVAPEESFLTDGRFAFAASLADTAEERENPWLLLHRRYDDGALPAIVDQTSLTYVFHKSVGDEIVLPDGTRLRIVAALADSVLQSEIIIAEDAFVRLFPRHEGYRVWLIDVADAPAAATMLEGRLADFGVDVTDTRVRLASYHRVENTYLSTFQALGALGLLLGTFGMSAVLARNVLERRREIGLLGAVGFTREKIGTLVLSEAGVLVLTGVTLGTIAASIAILPAFTARGGSPPVAGLLVLLAAVIVTALVSTLFAVRFAARMPIVSALRSE